MSQDSAEDVAVAPEYRVDGATPRATALKLTQRPPRPTAQSPDATEGAKAGQGWPRAPDHHHRRGRRRLKRNFRTPARRQEAQTMDPGTGRPLGGSRYPPARRRGPRARIAWQCRRLLQRLDTRTSQRLYPRVAQGHRRQSPSRRRARRRRHPGARRKHRRRAKRTRKVQGEPGAGEGDGGAVELAARIVGGVSTGSGRKGQPTPRARAPKSTPPSRTSIGSRRKRRSRTSSRRSTAL